MPGDVRVSLTLTGRHSLGPDGAKEACREIEGALSGGSVPYTIYCLDSKFTKRGEKSPERVTVDVNRTSYDVFWEAQSAFSVPDALHGVVAGCLKAAGRVRVMASATIAQVPITLPTIDGGSLAQKFSAIMFDLTPPKTVPENPAFGEMSFGGVASPSGDSAARITLLGECESSIAGAAQAMEYVLGSLSGYCEVYSK
ncbi:MAG: hypothetical protein OXU37_04800 [Thaumarchaeota archaeon]|nr:hypothetical protein [Nitrososphaerota archaeon]